MIRTVLIALLISSPAPSKATMEQGLDWGQDIRWSVALENVKKVKTSNTRQIVVKVDLRKSPFRKVERVVTKIAFFDASGTKVGESEFPLGDGRLQPGKLHIKTFSNPHTNAATVKGIELRAIIDGETYVNKPLKDDGRKIARRE